MTQHVPGPMRPLPATAQADALYGPFVHGDQDLLDRLVELGERVRGVVPSCVGLSLSLHEDGLTFTVVATSSQVALLDAIQYVDGGPCADALTQHHVVVTTRPTSIEAQWKLFGKAATAVGVASTLSLPMVQEGDRVGGFNIYASEPGAFTGRVDAVAAALGTWSGPAVLDGDLTFRTRVLASQAPELLRESTRLAVATALLAQVRGLTEVEAEEKLRRSALRAAVPLALLVDEMIEVLQDAPPDATS